ncbi:hypothetical protein SAMN05421855_102562 [Ulvibacter litoralis]|uniref:Uncharacterized protein n=1 Tax=Ulvibacter litoralis TaxID=227084 RepID=A0A1G7FI92_9FLAO|nr:hypothetical protein GCM10008083_13450 [Ulvibacter litoralis]SDE75255.1 hypothetical protein SAMN05421855_102562 [Ulvibacter litoralis]
MIFKIIETPALCFGYQCCTRSVNASNFPKIQSKIRREDLFKIINCKYSWIQKIDYIYSKF